MPENTDTPRARSKGPIVVRNALITPSASPPAPETAPSTIRHKSTSRPPPLKRSRVYSSSSSPQPSNRASSSSSRASLVDPTRDEAWRASSKRLLDVWSSLAERYNVPLDQDDIIDLRTVELVKDRGVVRGAKTTFEIGYFGDPKADESGGERGEEAEEVEEDEEDDELDAFAPEPLVPVKIEMEKVKRHVPPFREADPDDASDLREFLEAERLRREMEEEAFDEGEDLDIIDLVDISSDEGDGELESRVSSPGPAPCTHRAASRAHSSANWSRQSQPPLAVRKVIAECALTAPDDVSDDELAAWDADEPTPVPVAPRAAKSHNKAHKPAMAPPVSSPTIRHAPTTRKSCPALPASPQLRLQSSRDTTGSSPARGSSPLASRALAITRNNQLRTPPTSHSESSVVDGTPDIRLSPARPSTRLLSRSSKVNRVKTPPPSLPGAPRIPLPSSDPQASHRAKTPAMPTRIVEVVLPTRSHIAQEREKLKHSPPNSPGGVTRRSGVLSPANPQEIEVTSKETGKAREARNLSVFEDLSDDEPLPPPPKMRRSTTQPPLSSPGFFTARRKRKRPSISSANSSEPDRQLKPPTPASSKPTIAKLQRSPSEPARSRRNPERKGKAKASQISDDDSDHRPRGRLNQKDRRRSASQPRSSSRVGNEPAIPTFPYPPSMLPVLPTVDHKRARDQRRLAYPPFPPIQDPQTQYNLAHAVNYLTYVLSQGVPNGYPPPQQHLYRQPSAHWPQTPPRRSRGRAHSRSSSPTRTSSPTLPFAYITPSHRYLSPSDPGYSSATSPPMSSSPMLSSPTWPPHLPPMNAKAHSKSRGRKVSFKIDSDDDEHPRKRADGNQNRRDDRKVSRSAAQAPNPPRRTPKQPRSPQRVDDRSSDEESDVRQPRGERGRTPGPSSRHTRSNSARH